MEKDTETGLLDEGRRSRRAALIAFGIVSPIAALLILYNVNFSSLRNAYIPAEQADCHRYLEGKLRSPSTLKVIRSASTDVPYPNSRYRHVSIEYDAANAYGTPVRDRQLCFYPLKGGVPMTKLYIDHDNEVDNALSGKGMFAEGANLQEYDLESAADKLEQEAANLIN